MVPVNPPSSGSECCLASASEHMRGSTGRLRSMCSPLARQPHRIWGIANTLPQVMAPVIGGPLLDIFNRTGSNVGYSVIFSLAVVEVALGSAFVWKIKGTR